MLKNILTSLFVLYLLLFTRALPVQSISEILVPDFPGCTSPSGTPKVIYNSGTHGIVGQGEVSGSDAVYFVGDSNIMQCYCSVDGRGIQTNWWKFSSLSHRQIDSLKKLGWIYVPDGQAWGLEKAPYLARNISYSCAVSGVGGSSGSNGGTGGPGSAPVCDSAKPQAPTLLSVSRRGGSATLTWTKVDNATHYTVYYGPDSKNWAYSVPDTGNVTQFTINGLNPGTDYSFSVRGVNNCMPGDPSVNPQVLGASTGQVLGLAATGNWLQIVLLLALAAASLGMSVLSRRSGRVK